MTKTIARDSKLSRYWREMFSRTYLFVLIAVLSTNPWVGVAKEKVVDGACVVLSMATSRFVTNSGKRTAKPGVYKVTSVSSPLLDDGKLSELRYFNSKDRRFEDAAVMFPLEITQGLDVVRCPVDQDPLAESLSKRTDRELKQLGIAIGTVFPSKCPAGYKEEVSEVTTHIPMPPTFRILTCSSATGAFQKIFLADEGSRSIAHVEVIENAAVDCKQIGIERGVKMPEIMRVDIQFKSSDQDVEFGMFCEPRESFPDVKPWARKMNHWRLIVRSSYESLKKVFDANFLVRMTAENLAEGEKRKGQPGFHSIEEYMKEMNAQFTKIEASPVSKALGPLGKSILEQQKARLLDRKSIQETFDTWILEYRKKKN